MNLFTGLVVILLFLVVVSVLWRGRRRGTDSSLNNSNYILYDMHTHILPGVDHGAADLDTALAMLRKEAEDGVEHVVLTPHYFPGRNQKETIRQQFQILSEQLHSQQIPIHIYMGNEMRCNEQNLSDLEEGLVCTLGDTSYVLAEFHTDDSFQMICGCINRIQVNGYRPVIAHIERYHALEKEEAVQTLVRMGALIQVNAGSFQKKGQGRYLLTLAKKDLIHVIGSDCHDLTKRPPGVNRAAELLSRKLTREQYERICFGNPSRILKDEYIKTDHK